MDIGIFLCYSFEVEEALVMVRHPVQGILFINE
jgi:hypothetical protein